jgi:surface protein
LNEENMFLFLLLLYMSLATLARKTRAKQRVKTRGKFVLNMTGRGTVSHKTNRGPCGLKYNKTGTSKCTFRGSNATCCNDNSKCKQFPHGGVPAPQMGYGIYLNKKNHGGYRPSGGKCCKNSEAQKNAKIVWKKSPDTDASDLIRRRKDKVLACNNDVYSQSKNKKVCLVKKNMCGCNSTDKVDYTRINHNWCTTTKAIPQNRTAGEQIARNRAVVSNECVCTYKGPLTDGPTEQCGTIRWAVNQYFSTIPHGRKFSKGGIYNQYGIIEEWDTSLITNMDGLFKDRSTFNKNLGQWNLTNVTSVREMFYGASSFNNDTISASALPPPSSMLQSNVALSSASAQPSLNDWDVSNVTNMGYMFYEAAVFDQDIGSWNVSNVTDMKYMFNSTTAFKQDIGEWDVSNVRDMAFMFLANIRNYWENTGYGDDGQFEGDLSNWNVENVTNMQGMFMNQLKINFDVSSWNVSKVTDMKWMLYGAATFIGNGLDRWEVSQVTDMALMFAGAYKLGDSIAIDLNGWDVSNVTDMGSMFESANLFNGNIFNWNVGNVTNMGGMFSGAQSFNQDIGLWDVSNVRYMAFMFASAILFNGEMLLIWL